MIPTTAGDLLDMRDDYTDLRPFGVQASACMSGFVAAVQAEACTLAQAISLELVLG